MERRLSAILAADVVGFSRLIGEDELGTLTALKAHRAELIDDSIARHQGRIVKLTGDGILVEFASVVNALNCATELQTGMRERNGQTPTRRRIEFRIGINLGDVVFEDGDIFGDGVNVAARIEGIARPGGIAVSGTVRDHVGNRIGAVFEDGGPQMFKNISRPVHVYHVLDQDQDQSGTENPAKAGEQPSIAVLPFDNMSGDPEQEYFSDGITEDIITDLSKLSDLRVIARNSVFAYKGKPIDIHEVGRRFNVAAVLEGSVRKAGQRVRITAQLISCHDSSHLWADRYDRDLTDIFQIQDEIARQIVEQLKVRLLPEEQGSIAQKPTADVGAYELYLQARRLLRVRTREAIHSARTLFDRAIERDPLFARAYAGIADCDVYLRAWYGEDVSVATILGLCGYALALDERLPEAETSRGYALHFAGRRDEATAAFERAIAIDPDAHEVCFAFARFSFACGAFERAADLFHRAMTVQPDDYRSPNLLRKALTALGRSGEAEDAARIAVHRATEALTAGESAAPLQVGAVALAALGLSAQAREWISRALALEPDDHNALFNAACTYALLGETSTAAHHLANYLRPLGPDEHDWCRNDPDLARLHDEPGLPTLTSKAPSTPL